MMEFKLQNPITYRTWLGTGNKIEMVTVRSPKVKDLLHLTHPPTQEGFARIVSNCSDIPYEVLLEMDAGDYQRLSDIVGKMMQGHIK